DAATAISLSYHRAKAFPDERIKWRALAQFPRSASDCLGSLALRIAELHQRGDSVRFRTVRRDDGCGCPVRMAPQHPGRRLILQFCHDPGGELRPDALGAPNRHFV